MGIEYREELYRTPEILERVLTQGPEPLLIQAPELIFCGCGTTYYLSAQLARLCAARGRCAGAVEAVELLDGPLRARPGAVVCFLSRSGESAETVEAMHAVRAEGYATFYLGCTEGSALDRGCGASRVLPFAKEQLVLESFSFSAQLLCLALCCGVEVSPQLPQLVCRALLLGGELYRRELAGMDIRRMICLGAPFYMPLLRELSLKNGELTRKFSEVWGLLEFRHGPRSWADEGCLITAVPGLRTLEYDCRAADELATYGCRVVWCGPSPRKGMLHAALGTTRRSVEEVLALTAFQNSLAAEIGRVCGVDAASLPHVVHSVGTL